MSFFFISGHFPARYTFALLGFLGMANVYAMRVNLSVAMVAMVNSSAFPHSDISSECSTNQNNTNITLRHEAKVRIIIFKI